MIIALLLLPLRSLGQLYPAFEFDGTNAWTQYDTSFDFSPAQGWTISAWIYPEDVALNTIASKFLSNAGWTWEIAGGTMRIFQDNASPANELEASTSVVQVSTWQHVCLVVSDEDVVEIYLDGIDGTPASDMVWDQDESTSDPLRVGNSTISSRDFDGIIDDVRIYDYALTQNDVSALMEFGRAAGVEGVVERRNEPLYGDLLPGVDDLSGNEIHARAPRTTKHQDDTGIYREFDGSTSYIWGPHNAALGMISKTNDWSISLFVNSADAGVVQSLFSKQHRSTSAPIGPNFEIASDKLRVFVDDASLANELEAQSTSTLTDNTWHHVACVHNTSGDRIELYVDGIENSDDSLTTSVAFGNTYDFHIGNLDNSWFGGQRHLDGYMAQYLIYDRALTSNEVVTISTAGRGQGSADHGVTNGVILEYDFEMTYRPGGLLIKPYARVIPGNTISTVYDASTYGNSGTASNGVTAAIPHVTAGPGDTSYDYE